MFKFLTTALVNIIIMLICFRIVGGNPLTVLVELGPSEAFLTAITLLMGYGVVYDLIFGRKK